MIDRAKARFGREDGRLWDAEGWYGGVPNRAVIRSEGEGTCADGLGHGAVAAAWSLAIGPCFDLPPG